MAIYDEDLYSVGPGVTRLSTVITEYNYNSFNTSWTLKTVSQWVGNNDTTLRFAQYSDYNATWNYGYLSNEINSTAVINDRASTTTEAKFTFLPLSLSPFFPFSGIGNFLYSKPLQYL
tara:strand:- start:65 stop:418 length:354 start_codon:yes stop_codon:yes gene_type:complete